MVNFHAAIDTLFHDWHYDHPRILYALMRSLKPRVAVEVGTYRGYAACWMAQALKENGGGHLYCIDDFSEGMQKKYDASHWHTNLQAMEVQEYATLVVGKSTEVQWPAHVDFAYIDGWHSYKQVVADFEAAASLGATCICLDDVTSTVGPSFFIQKLDLEWDVVELFRDCGLAICVHRTPKPPCNFSQELANNPGTVMTGWTSEQKRAHLDAASKETGINYSEFEC